MASWSSKRKFAYTSAFMVVALSFLVSLYFLVFYKQPTCFDGSQNGSESGVDCGGSCQKVCEFEAAEPDILWSRSFKVSPNNYSAAAYIENPNIDTEAFDVPYIFKLFDENNILVYEKKGETYIPPKSTFVIFEPSISTNVREPKYTFFEFESVPNWQKTNRRENPLRIKTQTLSSESLPVKLEALIENPSLKDIKNVEVIAILYAASGNAIATSRTVISEIRGEGEAPVVFTWPEKLPEKAVKIEIVPTIKP